MIKKNLLKGICLLWLLLAVTPVLQAQDRAQQASELLDRLIASPGSCATGIRTSRPTDCKPRIVRNRHPNFSTD